MRDVNLFVTYHQDYLIFPVKAIHLNQAIQLIWKGLLFDSHEILWNLSASLIDFAGTPNISHLHHLYSAVVQK